MLFSEFNENVQMLSQDLGYEKFEFYKDLESIYMNSNISKREVYLLAGLIINLSRNRTAENKEVKRAIKTSFNFKLYLLNEEFEKSN